MIFSFELNTLKQGCLCWFMRIGLQNFAKLFCYQEIFFINFNSKNVCRNEFQYNEKSISWPWNKFVRFRQTIYERVKQCQKKLNTCELAKFVLFDDFGSRSVVFLHSFVQFRYQDYSQMEIFHADGGFCVGFSLRKKVTFSRKFVCRVWLLSGRESWFRLGLSHV